MIIIHWCENYSRVFPATKLVLIGLETVVFPVIVDAESWAGKVPLMVDRKLKLVGMITMVEINNHFYVGSDYLAVIVSLYSN